MDFDTLLESGMVDHVEIAREKAGIEQDTAIDLRYYSEDADVLRELGELFSPAFNSPLRVVSAHSTSPDLQSDPEWSFALGGREITLWVTEYES